MTEWSDNFFYFYNFRTCETSVKNQKSSMNIESIREYCLSLPLATEAFPFDERTLAFRIFDKIFGSSDISSDATVMQGIEP